MCKKNSKSNRGEHIAEKAKSENYRQMLHERRTCLQNVLMSLQGQTFVFFFRTTLFLLGIFSIILVY